MHSVCSVPSGYQHSISREEEERRISGVNAAPRQTRDGLLLYANRNIKAALLLAHLVAPLCGGSSISAAFRCLRKILRARFTARKSGWNVAVAAATMASCRCAQRKVATARRRNPMGGRATADAIPSPLISPARNAHAGCQTYILRFFRAGHRKLRLWLFARTGW